MYEAQFYGEPLITQNALSSVPLVMLVQGTEVYVGNACGASTCPWSLATPLRCPAHAEDPLLEQVAVDNVSAAQPDSESDSESESESGSEPDASKGAAAAWAGSTDGSTDEEGGEADAALTAVVMRNLQAQRQGLRGQHGLGSGLAGGSSKGSTSGIHTSSSAIVGAAAGSNAGGSSAAGTAPTAGTAGTTRPASTAGSAVTTGTGAEAAPEAGSETEAETAHGTQLVGPGELVAGLVLQEMLDELELSKALADLASDGPGYTSPWDAPGPDLDLRLAQALGDLSPLDAPGFDATPWPCECIRHSALCTHTPCLHTCVCKKQSR